MPRSVLEYTAQFQERGFMHVFFGTRDPFGPNAYSTSSIRDHVLMLKKGFGMPGDCPLCSRDYCVDRVGDSLSIAVTRLWMANRSPRKRVASK